MAEQEALVARCHECGGIVPVVVSATRNYQNCRHCGRFDTTDDAHWEPVSRLGLKYEFNTRLYITRPRKEG